MIIDGVASEYTIPNTHNSYNCLIEKRKSNKYDECIVLKVLKGVLKINDYCSLCKYVEHIKGGYIECTLGFSGCNNCMGYAIDWEALAKEYGLKEEQ